MGEGLQSCISISAYTRSSVYNVCVKNLYRKVCSGLKEKSNLRKYIQWNNEEAFLLRDTQIK